MGLLENKRALITGLISDRSIAHGIADAFHKQGAQLAFTYQSEKVKDRVCKIAEKWNSSLVYQCDVSSDENIQQVFTSLNEHWDTLDILIHSIAFAPSDQLEGDYFDCVNRDGFRIAHDVSSYSLAALAKAAHPMMKDQRGSILAMTYLGAERTVQNYNVMGVAKASLEANVRYLANSLGPKDIRVNAISAGPIRTLAASGIKDLRKMLSYYETIAPLRRKVTIEEVGDTAAFLCSDMARGITGEVIHVDAGYHIIGMPAALD
ncbi:MAG: enoyl-ACP reductase [Pseudomonadota bacterium]